MEVLGVSLGPTVDLGRVDYSLQPQDVQRWRWHGHSWRHRLVDGTRFFFRTLSGVLPLESLLVLLLSLLSLLSLLINGNSTPYISSSKSGRVSEFLVLSHTFQNVHSCIRNHSVPQITVSVVRQTAHNMHTACIASCIHVTKNSNNAFTTAGFTPCLAHAIIIFSGFVTPPPLEKKGT